MKHPLKIALVLETSGGGSGRHVLDLALGLMARGHAVTVVWSPTRAEEDFIAGLARETVIHNLQISMSRAVHPGDLSDLRALIRLFRTEQPFDVIHAHSSKAGALVRLLPRSIPGTRIYTPHAFRTMDLDLKQPQRAIYSTVERLLASRSSQIIVVSSAERDHAIELGIDPALVRIVVNGVKLPPEASRTAARQDMQLNNDEIAVGFIGRLETQKDPLRFVDALTHAVKAAPRIRGIVIGDGTLREAAEQGDMAGALTFMGWQNAPKLIAGFDIFCMTSQYEAMPYTLLEALHAGIPIVTTAVGGAAETVIEGENGHVLPLDSPATAIGDALARLANDPAQRHAFGQASRTFAKSRTLDVMVDETIAVYDEAGTKSNQISVSL